MANPNWVKGHKSTGGRPASIWAGQADVSDALLRKYTPEEIIELAGDTKRMSKELSSFQAIILIQLANALSARDNNDNALERERLLDRVVGKPVSRTELTGKNGAPLQINVITGVNAIDAEFVNVDNANAVEQNAIEHKPETELSAAEKLEIKRVKKKADKKPSFNDRLAAKSVVAD